MNYNGQIMESGEFISRLMNSIESNTFNTNSKLMTIWKKVVGSVRNYGERLTAHTQVVDIKNGVLLIETDHTSWNQILQLNSKYILNGLQIYGPEYKISSLAFRVKGNEAKLFDTYEEALEKSRAALEEKMSEDEKTVNEFYKKLNGEKNEKSASEPVKIEGELAEKLERLKMTMLTSTKEK